MFTDIDSVELASGDRVAAMDDAGKMRKGRVDGVQDIPGVGLQIGVTFHKGDTVHLRSRDEVLPLYRYAKKSLPLVGETEVMLPFVTLPAAK